MHCPYRLKEEDIVTDGDYFMCMGGDADYFRQQEAERFDDSGKLL